MCIYWNVCVCFVFEHLHFIFLCHFQTVGDKKETVTSNVTFTACCRLAKLASMSSISAPAALPHIRKQKETMQTSDREAIQFNLYVNNSPHIEQEHIETSWNKYLNLCFWNSISGSKTHNILVGLTLASLLSTDSLNHVTTSCETGATVVILWQFSPTDSFCCCCQCKVSPWQRLTPHQFLYVCVVQPDFKTWEDH